MALIALIFLVAITSSSIPQQQIIGARIKNPMWLTLLASCWRESMACPGMILAPVVCTTSRSKRRATKFPNSRVRT